MTASGIPIDDDYVQDFQWYNDFYGYYGIHNDGGRWEPIWEFDGGGYVSEPIEGGSLGFMLNNAGNADEINGGFIYQEMHANDLQKLIQGYQSNFNSLAIGTNYLSQEEIEFPKITSKNLKKPNKIASLRFLIPKAYREEFIGDLIEMQVTLENEGHSKWWVFSLMVLQIANVIWHAAFFKLKELFPNSIKKD